MTDARCHEDGCEDGAVWEVRALLLCGCTQTASYCKPHGRALWYQSGLVGMMCPDNRRHGGSQLTYHPRRIGTEGTACLLCGADCPAFKGN